VQKQEIDRILKHTLSDHKLSRGEKKIIRAIVDETCADDNDLAYLRHRAFEIASGELMSPETKDVLTWLEEVVKALQPRTVQPTESSAYFSPNDNSVHALTQQFRIASDSVDICVFTITDDRITQAIRQAHDHNVKIRIITDNDKAFDPGSDVSQIRNLGIPIVTDKDSNHMHHKYAIFDGKTLLSGSYNWTRSAAERNEENFVITHEAKLVHSFQRNFDGLWKQFS